MFGLFAAKITLSFHLLWIDKKLPIQASGMMGPLEHQMTCLVLSVLVLSVLTAVFCDDTEDVNDNG